MGKRKFVEDDEVDEGDLSDSEDVNKWVTNNGEGQNGKSSSKEEERPWLQLTKAIQNDPVEETECKEETERMANAQTTSDLLQKGTNRSEHVEFLLP